MRRADRMGGMNGYALLPAGFFLSKLFLFFQLKDGVSFLSAKVFKTLFPFTRNKS